MRLPSKAFWLKAGVLLAIVGTAGTWFSANYRIVIDPQKNPSLARRVLIVDLKDRTPVRDGVFAFHTRRTAPVFEEGTLFAKVMRGMPGDRVEVTKDFRILVNGIELARGLPLYRDVPADMLRRKFSGAKTLGEGEYWMLGTTPGSFDSRYWGVMKDDQIVGRAYPLF